MPSIEESKRQVKAGLADEHVDDHDSILASLQDEIDRHNAQTSDSASHPGEECGHSHRGGDDNEPRSSMRFRFKNHTSNSDERKRKHRSKHGSRHHHRKHRKTRRDSEEEDAAHPFPREPTDPDQAGRPEPNVAFQDSLFDALADDEGAAYWESVYSQPIHVYQRPFVETAKGELEEMNDDQYAAYVQTKMWEKQNPHIMQERERKEKERKEEEEERMRRREEFVRRKERAAWERAEKNGARKFAGVNSENEENDDYEYVFDFEDRTKSRSKRSSNKSASANAAATNQQSLYETAWRLYLAAWDKLKVELLNARDASSSNNETLLEPSKRIPWPVIQPKPVTRPNIEDFMRHIPGDQDGPSKLQLLKAERVRWHPDKIQQRFGGQVDEGTMKIVTGVFQVVDTVFSEEQKR